MGVIQSATIQTLLTTFRGELQATIAAATPTSRAIAMTVPSTGRANTYGFINDIAGMREWLGDRHVHDLSESDYTLKNRKFENTFGISADDFDDDQYGTIKPVIQTYAMGAAHLEDALVYDRVNSAYSATGFDGVAFFGSHSWHGKTFQNYESPGLAFDGPNWAIVRAKLRKQIADPGDGLTDIRMPFASFGHGRCFYKGVPFRFQRLRIDEPVQGHSGNPHFREHHKLDLLGGVRDKPSDQTVYLSAPARTPRGCSDLDKRGRCVHGRPFPVRCKRTRGIRLRLVATRLRRQFISDECLFHIYRLLQRIRRKYRPGLALGRYRRSGV
jgi:hypothetical protein